MIIKRMEHVKDLFTEKKIVSCKKCQLKHKYNPKKMYDVTCECGHPIIFTKSCENTECLKSYCTVDEQSLLCEQCNLAKVTKCVCGNYYNKINDDYVTCDKCKTIKKCVFCRAEFESDCIFRDICSPCGVIHNYITNKVMSHTIKIHNYIGNVKNKRNMTRYNGEICTVPDNGCDDLPPIYDDLYVEVTYAAASQTRSKYCYHHDVCGMATVDRNISCLKYGLHKMNLPLLKIYKKNSIYEHNSINLICPGSSPLCSYYDCILNENGRKSMRYSNKNLLYIAVAAEVKMRLKSKLDD